MTRRSNVTVRLAAGTQEALRKLDEDTQTLSELVQGLLFDHGRLHALLAEDIEAAENGDQTVIAEQQEPPDEPPAGPPAKELPNGWPELPEGMRPGMFDDTTGGSRIRNMRAASAPRTVQYKWLREVLADGDWHTSLFICEAYAETPSHLYYLKGAVTSRLKELRDSGELERVESTFKGTTWMYRLKT